MRSPEVGGEGERGRKKGSGNSTLGRCCKGRWSLGGRG